MIFSNNASFGTGPLTFSGGTSLASAAQIYAASTTGVTALANNLVVTTGSFGAYVGSRAITFSGTLNGSGTFAITPNTLAGSITLSGDNHAFAGTLAYVDNGATPLFLGSVNSGSANALWSLSGGSSKGIGANVAGSNTFFLGEVASPSGLGRLFNNQSTGTATFQIGDATGNAPIFGGFIADGTAGGKVALTKVGANRQILTNVENYAGPTTINGGTLEVDGILAPGSAVLINAGGTLAGSGIIDGPATVASGGMIGPLGSSTLIFNGGLNLNGSAILNFDLAGVTASDEIALRSPYVAPANGTVTINLNARAGFRLGTYPLITGATGISASSFKLGVVPAAYTYQLTASGNTLSVIVSSASTLPVS